jgi:hypothetical protein
MEETKKLVGWVIAAIVAVAAAVTNPDVTKFQTYAAAQGFNMNASNCHATQTGNWIVASFYEYACSVDVDGPGGGRIRGDIVVQYAGLFNGFFQTGRKSRDGNTGQESSF